MPIMWVLFNGSGDGSDKLEHGFNLMNHFCAVSGGDDIVLRFPGVGGETGDTYDESGGFHECGANAYEFAQNHTLAANRAKLERDIQQIEALRKKEHRLKDKGKSRRADLAFACMRAFFKDRAIGKGPKWEIRVGGHSRGGSTAVRFLNDLHTKDLPNAFNRVSKVLLMDPVHGGKQAKVADHYQILPMAFRSLSRLIVCSKWSSTFERRSVARISQDLSDDRVYQLKGTDHGKVIKVLSGKKAKFYQSKSTVNAQSNSKAAMTKYLAEEKKKILSLVEGGERSWQFALIHLMTQSLLHTSDGKQISTVQSDLETMINNWMWFVQL